MPPAGQTPVNILVLMADQFAAHALSCAGAEHLSTPALDALAARGTRFTRAYTSFPLCVPARASMMTGRYPHELGLRGNATAAPEPARAPGTLGHLLRAAGYETAYAGKWHARQASADPRDGFDVVAPFGDRGLADRAAAWLRSREDEQRPFAFVVSFDDPHTICEYARHQAMPYGPVDVTVSPRDLPPLPAAHLPAPYEPQALRHEQRRAAAMYGTEEYDADDWRRYRHAYARLVERADRQLGTVLAALDESGLTERTVVVFTSDHGDGDAAHRWNQKTALFEQTCRVPLIVSDPRRTDHGSTSAALAGVGVDLLPTLAGIAGTRPTTGTAGDAGTDVATAVTGVDLLGVLNGTAGHEQLVVQTAFEAPAGSGTRGRALVTDRYKYVVYGWGAHREQLVDLLADPDERRNLAVESAFDPVLEDLRGRLLDWCLRTDDTDFLPRLALPASTPQTIVDRIARCRERDLVEPTR